MNGQEADHLVNDLYTTHEVSGGFNFVTLLDADDGDKFLLGEDEIIALYRYLKPITRYLMPLIAGCLTPTEESTQKTKMETLLVVPSGKSIGQKSPLSMKHLDHGSPQVEGKFPRKEEGGSHSPWKRLSVTHGLTAIDTKYHIEFRCVVTTRHLSLLNSF